ncbi:uncharacterized protein LOC127533324 [Acanthochromis polyacanthus]|uniref:uncharacterized protein LOC127533324 n=1 Tax=Acanthochromis polyacanthus TaxID=80966 RepID=UPI002233F4E1|nr:uncharacterized protein LOC127533324 [Acanthochromis polyacanthus]
MYELDHEVCSETDNPVEADERRECIELLEAMLQWDEKDRITPSGILNHPFITRSYLNSSSPTSSCDEPKPSTSMSIMGKPADPETRSNLTGLPDEDSDLEEKNRENIKAEREKDGYPENIQDRKNSEDNKKPVKQEINECEDTKDSDDEDTEASVNHEDAEDIKDSGDDKDTKASDNHEDAEDSEKEQSKAKKKKNCFQRVFSWIKKKFCCCCCVSDVMD